MRIAQVTCNLECGGSVVMVVALSAKLADIGHEVDVVCLDRPTGSAHECLLRGVLDRQRVSVRFLGRKLGYPGIASALQLWWLVQSENYDVVHSHLPLADAITGAVRRVSLVRFRHVLTIHTTLKPRFRIIAACGSGANVVYCSDAARRQNSITGVSSVVIPNGIVQSSYQAPCPQRAATRRSLGFPDAAIVVIAVGRMCPLKNFDSALDAIAILKRWAPKTDVRFLFCGDGPEKERLERRVADLRIEGCVQFVGGRTDIPALLGASDVFLSTSLFEGMPLAVLEALTAGLPCVLSSIDGHYEIAGNMPGCAFVRSANPEEVSLSLQAFVKDPISPGILRQARGPLLEKFSIEACVASYADFYQSLLLG